MNDSEIVVSKIVKTYKGNVRALDELSVTIPRGEVFGLIGPNGAGKTTLIGCLLGLLQPDSGTVSVFGKSPNSLAIRRLTGYMPERPEFEYWMTGLQFLRYHHGMAGIDARMMNKDVESALTSVDIAQSAWNRKLKTYSRGMLQRLNLAQMLIGKPRLMLLDEPTLGLDPAGVAVVRNTILSLKERGVTAIVNSHQLDEIERVCDRVAFIRKGQIARIEDIKGGNFQDYEVYVKWSGNQNNGKTNSLAMVAAYNSGSILRQCHHDWGTFRVRDHEAASKLVRELVVAGIPVDEITPERMRLEQLFATTYGGQTDE